MAEPIEPELALARRWRRAGIAVQGVLMGLLLTWAALVMTTVATGARLFRYQGF